jgi:hypothetical protein
MVAATRTILSLPDVAVGGARAPRPTRRTGNAFVHPPQDGLAIDPRRLDDLLQIEVGCGHCSPRTPPRRRFLPARSRTCANQPAAYEPCTCQRKIHEAAAERMPFRRVYRTPRTATAPARPHMCCATRAKQLLTNPSRTRRYHVPGDAARTVTAILPIRDHMITAVRTATTRSAPQALDRYRPRLRHPPARHADPTLPPRRRGDMTA